MSHGACPALHLANQRRHGTHPGMNCRGVLSQAQPATAFRSIPTCGLGARQGGEAKGEAKRLLWAPRRGNSVQGVCAAGPAPCHPSRISHLRRGGGHHSLHHRQPLLLAKLRGVQGKLGRVGAQRVATSGSRGWQPVGVMHAAEHSNSAARPALHTHHPPVPAAGAAPAPAPPAPP